MAGEAVIRLIAAKLALGLLPFRLVAGTISSRGRRPANSEQAQRIAWAIGVAVSRIPLRLTCLRQALAGAWMLKARGFAPRLHYGVAKASDGSFQSHAWLEVDGLPVLGHEAAGAFSPLASFPEETADSRQS